jgi:predicted  nucleic acid-binding Zn ribbon protein
MNARLVHPIKLARTFGKTPEEAIEAAPEVYNEFLDQLTLDEQVMALKSLLLVIAQRSEQIQEIADMPGFRDERLEEAVQSLRRG